ncbi:MAG: hypothetical protein V1734_04105 [Nanoarchaeota archaeon]
MKSLKDCLQNAKYILNKKGPGTLEEAGEDISRIEQILEKGENACYSGICYEIYVEAGVRFMHCKTSGYMPEPEFRKYCGKCMKEIKKEIPKLKRKYEKLVAKKN